MEFYLSRMHSKITDYYIIVLKIASEPRKLRFERPLRTKSEASYKHWSYISIIAYKYFIIIINLSLLIDKYQVLSR